MSELSILELETEHAELLPEREALNGFHGFINGGGNHVSVTQTSVSISAHGTVNDSTATSTAIIAVG